MDNFRRSRQFKMLLSTEEWYALLSISETEEKTISDVLRTFITRRAYDLQHPATQDIRSIADTLMEVSRKLRTISMVFERGPPRGLKRSPGAAPEQCEWQAPELDLMFSQEDGAAGGHPDGDK
jgi:hypothetical protein